MKYISPLCITGHYTAKQFTSVKDCPLQSSLQCSTVHKSALQFSTGITVYYIAVYITIGKFSVAETKEQLTRPHGPGEQRGADYYKGEEEDRELSTLIDFLCTD